jgi:hypothetical protein
MRAIFGSALRLFAAALIADALWFALELILGETSMRLDLGDAAWIAAEAVTSLVVAAIFRATSGWRSRVTTDAAVALLVFVGAGLVLPVGDIQLTYARTWFKTGSFTEALGEAEERVRIFTGTSGGVLNLELTIFLLWLFWIAPLVPFAVARRHGSSLARAIGLGAVASLALGSPLIFVVSKDKPSLAVALAVHAIALAAALPLLERKAGSSPREGESSP